VFIKDMPSVKCSKKRFLKVNFFFFEKKKITSMILLSA